MNRNYQEVLIEVMYLHDDIITSSTGSDVFNDNYEDPNITFES